MAYDFDPEFAELVPQLPVGLLGAPGDDSGDAPDGVGDVLATLMGESPPPDDITVEDRVVPGLAGDPDVEVRIYTPRAESNGPRPGLFYIHGGGFMMGSIAMMDGACQRYCADVGLVVVSVEYRLAPAHPYPAPLDDCYAGLLWMAEHADELGVDPARIGVGGGSAGAGLAAGVALRARDESGPPLCFQFLQIPELDDRLDTPSMIEFTDTPLWNRPNAEISWRCYLGELHGTDDVPYYAAPSRCPDLTGLPPAYVSTMQFDPLRDEGLIYAQRLLQAGVTVELHSYPGTFHGSAIFSHAAVSRREADESITVMRRAFGVDGAREG